MNYAQTMLGPAIIKLYLLSSICLLLPVICIAMLTTSVAQTNNNNTNLVQNAIQGAPSSDSRYLKSKVIVKGLELYADVPVTGELMSKCLSVKGQLNENEAMLFVFEQSDRHSFGGKI